MEYLIRRASTQKPRLDGVWSGEAWRNAQTASIASVHPRSGPHHPITQMRALYDDGGLYICFRVQDRYVRSVHTGFQNNVCLDSCVEAFLEPKASLGYFNIEINCGGALLCYYFQDSVTEPGGGKFTRIPDEHLRLIRIYHSMPEIVEPEITEPTEWHVEYFVPNAFFERYVGLLEQPSQRRWRGNFYKCADQTSHPHWIAWSSIGEGSSFHQPARFSPIRFQAEEPAARAELG